MKKFSAIALVFMVGVGLISKAQAMPSKSELSETAALLIDDLLNREDLMWYRSDVFNGFHYAEAVSVYGALQVANQLGDKKRLKALQEKYLEIPDFDTLADYHHVDGSVIGIVPFELYKTLGDEKLKQQGLWLADAQWNNPWENGMTSQSRYWIDDIYMINAIQMQAYRLTGERKYLDRAALNTREYLQKIQQKNGLFWHGPEAPFFWGRGNGWVAAGVAELLRELPKDHKEYKEITRRYRAMMRTLLQHQAESGMWRQLVTSPESWEESSATAMFAWSMLVGIQQGILDERQYLPAVASAWKGLLLLQLGEDGRLKEICVGTGQSKDKQYYLERPRIVGDLHGQAPMLWLIGAFLEMN